MKQTKLIPLLGLGFTLFLSKPHMIYGNATFGGGSGTMTDPYRLSTPQHLTELQVAVDGGNSFSEKYFILTNDIDFTGYDNDSNPDNGNFDAIGKNTDTELNLFSGCLNGGGYTISNLQILTPEDTAVGFFLAIYQGRVENLNLSNIKIEGGGVVGGIAGSTIMSSISNSSVSGEILGNEQGEATGGIVGGDMYSSFDGISFSGTVHAGNYVGGIIGQSMGSMIKKVNADGTISGNTLVGGVVGFLLESEISKASSFADVEGIHGVGGLTGSGTYSTVSESFSQGNILGQEIVGGLVGGGNDMTLYNNYSLSKVRGGVTVGGVVGMAFSELETEINKLEKTFFYGEVEGTQNTGILIGTLGLFDDYTNEWSNGLAYLDNVYYNKEKNTDYPLIGDFTHGTIVEDNTIGLMTTQMIQNNAKNYMSTLDFENTWFTTSTTPMFRWQNDLISANEGEVQINGSVETMIADVTIPSVSPDLVINPNLSEGFVAPEFSVSNDSVSPIKLELKTFEQVTDTFNDVLPSKYDSWTGLNKRQSQDIALGLVAKEGEGWQSLTTPTSYVANHTDHEIGIIKPTSSVDFSFDVKHGMSFSEAKTVQYKMVFVFDLMN